MKNLYVTSASLALFTGLVISAQLTAAPSKELAFHFRAQLLQTGLNEGCAIGDINHDGKPDVMAGEYWFAAPDFTPRRFRKLLPFGKDYLQNNGDHLYDVDGDGWLDVVSGGFTTTTVEWFRNPGASATGDSGFWESKVLVDTQTTENEMTFLHDFDGDGVPEWVENSWNPNNPMLIWRFAKDATGAPSLSKHVIAEKGNGHGMGFGDVNGDGREDIVYLDGWYEQPAAGPYSGPWPVHHDFELPHASCPILVMDLNGDGKNDIIWGDGHNYGLYWEEQQAPQPDGSTTWRQHLIDKGFSQAHTLAWEDLDGDGRQELITGKRYYAHSGGDPGAEDPVVVYAYTWDKASGQFQKKTLSQGERGKGAGIGLQIRVADLDGNGLPDVLTAGKSGTHILWNESAPAQ